MSSADFLLEHAGPYENQECGVKYLAEKAVGRDDPVLMRADRPDLIGVGANSWVGHALGCYAEGFSLTSERGLN